MYGNDTDGFKTIVNLLNEIKEEEKKEWDEDVIKRTISKLLSIEKKAMYGSFRGKAKEMDKIILAELNRSQESNVVIKKN